MARLIKFTRIDGQLHLINPDHIIDVAARPDNGHTTIYLSTSVDNYVQVAETLESVYRRINLGETELAEAKNETI